jgi:hypothetical protein
MRIVQGGALTVPWWHLSASEEGRRDRAFHLLEGKRVARQPLQDGCKAMTKHGPPAAPQLSAFRLERENCFHASMYVA